jgi:hypothetical protein
VRLSDLTGSTADALRSAGAALSDLMTPTLRLGVTGLARSGKTVFITALVRSLLAGGRLPFFSAPTWSRNLTTPYRALLTRSTWRSWRAILRAGLKARGA